MFLMPGSKILLELLSATIIILVIIAGVLKHFIPDTITYLFIDNTLSLGSHLRYLRAEYYFSCLDQCCSLMEGPSTTHTYLENIKTLKYEH